MRTQFSIPGSSNSRQMCCIELMAALNRIEFKSWLCSRIKPFLEKAFNLNTGEYHLDIDETEFEAICSILEQRSWLQTDRMTDQLSAITLCACAEGYNHNPYAFTNYAQFLTNYVILLCSNSGVDTGKKGGGWDLSPMSPPPQKKRTTTKFTKLDSDRCSLHGTSSWSCT